MSAPGGSSYGGYGGRVCLSVCLGMPYSGETFGGSPPISSGGAGEGGASEGGAAGQGDGPIYCLSAPLGGAPPFEGGAGNGEGPNNGGAPG